MMSRLESNRWIALLLAVVGGCSLASAAGKTEGGYAIVVSKATHGQAAWKKVVDALVAKHGGAVVQYGLQGRWDIDQGYGFLG